MKSIKRGKLIIEGAYFFSRLVLLNIVLIFINWYPGTEKVLIKVAGKV
jgi:hypothetical protein